MPTARSGGQQEEQGPVAALLEYRKEILELESRLRRARLLRRFFRLSLSCIFLAGLTLYLVNIFEAHKANLKPVNWPLAILIVLAAIYCISYLLSKYEDSEKQAKNEGRSRYDVPRIELDLEVAQERRRLEAVSLNLSLDTRQHIYRDEVPGEIERYRSESTYYRRIHNTLQGVIIIGALAASTLTSLIASVPQVRWAAVATTFSVGVAAGFTGYFKFRERSFYLQQTSDSIEQELSAVGLGIGRYKAKPEDDALTEFTEQVELLKIEQRKRQQQLEQPSEGRESVQ
jgi:hypothetical protein